MLKYIILKCKHEDKVIIFAGELSHDSFKNIGTIISAGFVLLTPTAVKVKANVSGESWTLNIKSRPEDAKVIEDAIN